MNYHAIEFEVLGDERGSLVALESNINIPFEIKRTYYLFGIKPNVSRGYHAHKNLVQVAICLAGSCTMILDNGEEKKSVQLDKPNKGILIDKMIWHEMHNFSDDCILLVLADDLYNESDYIRSYDEFISIKNDGTES